MTSSAAPAIHDRSDGCPAPSPVRFALDGVEYEITLDAAAARGLRQLLHRYAVAGRPKPEAPRRRTARRRRPASST